MIDGGNAPHRLHLPRRDTDRRLGGLAGPGPVHSARSPAGPPHSNRRGGEELSAPTGSDTSLRTGVGELSRINVTVLQEDALFKPTTHMVPYWCTLVARARAAGHAPNTERRAIRARHWDVSPVCGAAMVSPLLSRDRGSDARAPSNRRVSRDNRSRRTRHAQTACAGRRLLPRGYPRTGRRAPHTCRTGATNLGSVGRALCGAQ